MSSWFSRKYAQPAPTGSIACVFTDIIGSTSLWSSFPSTMCLALKQHDKLLRACLKRHHGYEIKTTGDGFHVVFARASDALNFCLEGQMELQNAVWPREVVGFGAKGDDSSIRASPRGSLASWGSEGSGIDVVPSCKNQKRGLLVRMGIHFGNASYHEVNPVTGRTDYYGTTINTSARVCGHANGAEIAVSEKFIQQLWFERRKWLEGDKHEIAIDEELSKLVLRECVRVDGKGFFAIESRRDVRLKGLPEKLCLSLIGSVCTSECGCCAGNPMADNFMKVRATLTM